MARSAPPWCAGSGSGDVLRLGPPLGHLSLKVGSDRDLLLVAGGMGLAP